MDNRGGVKNFCVGGGEEFNTGNPLEIEGRGLGDDLARFAGIEPAHAVEVFQNVVYGEQRGGRFHQQRAEVVPAVVAGDDEFVVVRDDPRVVVLHADTGYVVPAGEIGFAEGDDETAGGRFGIARNGNFVPGGFFHMVTQFLSGIAQTEIGICRNEYHRLAYGRINTDDIGCLNRQRREAGGKIKKYPLHLIFSCLSEPVKFRFYIR